jgi:hypothetical protein
VDRDAQASSTEDLSLLRDLHRKRLHKIWYLIAARKTGKLPTGQTAQQFQKEKSPMTGFHF